MNTYAKSSHSGFTLAELMIALVVLGLLLSVAAPAFRNMILNTRVRNAAESVYAGLQQARAEAITRNANIEFTIAADTSWIIDYTTAYKAANPAVVSPIAVKAANEGSKNVAVVSNANDAVTATNRVTFNNLGRTVTPNADGTLPLGEINFSTVDGTRPLRVIVGVQTPAGPGNPYLGSIPKMCDPDPNLPSTNLIRC